jgi:small Trp-rich protein
MVFMGIPLLLKDGLALQYSNAILVSAVDARSTMYLLGLGIILLAMKYLEIGPVATWDWWVVLSPFGLAMAWWAWADWSGYTKRKAVERENEKKQARIDRSKEKLGIKTRRR